MVSTIRNVQAVIFDLDDTLIDRQKAVKSYFEWLVKNYCPTVDTDKNQIDYLLELDDSGRIDKHTFYDCIIQRWKLNCMTLSSFICIWKQEFPRHTIARKHAHEALIYLSQHYPLGLITNGYSDVQINKLKVVGMTQFFDEIVISDSIGYRKPDTKIFTKTCAILGVNVEQTVFIGDHIVNDIYGSQKAGLFPIWLKTTQDEVKVDCPIICDLLELKNYL